MNKVKDRVTLSIIAGGIGAIIMLAVDTLFQVLGLSQRSYRTTAAGVWVQSQRQAESWQGQLLGLIMNLGMSMVGAFGLICMLSKYGKDKIVLKGLFFGNTFGAFINAMLSGLINKKIKPKDAGSNLSYVASNAIFGLSTAIVAAKLGDDLLFDSKPLNNNLKPTKKTSEELRLESRIAAK